MTHASSDSGTSSVPTGPTAQIEAWHGILDEHGREHGFHKRLGDRHGVLFTEDDDILLVTLENADAIRQHNRTGLPDGLATAGREGWSHLCLYCEGDTFFRDPDVFGFLDELVDSGFFDQFERVVFYGAGSCGYAAAAFSVVAPEAIAILVRPLATLDPDLTEWDRRHPAMRRVDFTDRYGYAPAMLEGASATYVIHDPQVTEDAMHATLFAQGGATRLRCANLGPSPERDLAQMGILVPILRAAGRGKFNPGQFYDLYRRRHQHRPYLRRVLNRLGQDHRDRLRLIWARGVRAAIATGPAAQVAE